ncbi:MAG: xanthine dehydrogenase family protein molybdopterin-binding subunit, partial [Oscillospiraceae bacterium]|nr:xanthine dehydrogenase family protein molybdopterin-binding subunit [Oscillospiraceae bacterium]
MLTSNERVVGKRVTRKDSVPKVLGAAVYAGDLEMPGMIHGKTLRSIYPHAKILSIDTSEAEKIPGVHAVVTAKDLPGSNRYGLSLLDQEVLCEKKVRMVGDAIAFVAADTIALCEEALEKIKVEYEVLPAVLNVVDAIKDGAPLVHEDVKNNILQHTKVRKGEVNDDVWASCAYIVENDYVTQRVDHAYIEPEACVAYVDTKGVMNILNSTQYTFRDRKQLAPVFNMPVNMVRVAQQTTGGGFGGKDDLNAELAAGILALKTGKPVRVVWTRHESMTSSTKRHPMFTHVKTGCDKDGKLIAVEGTITSDKGAYCSIGHFITKKMGLHLAGPYYVPHVKVDTYSVYTNNIQCGPYRGFGILQASFCHDSQMDQLAELVGISPMEIRKRNALKVGLSTATGQVFEHGVGFEDTLLRMEEYMAETELGAPSGKTKKRGRGIGSNLYGVGYGFSRPDHSAAMIEVADDGTATVLSGACDIGQGSDTAFCQIAAEALGIPYENVRIISADTCATPDALASTASRQTFVSGKAVQLAG